MMNDQFITVIAEEDAEKRGHAGGRFYDGTSWESVAPKKKDPIEDPPKKKEHHNPLTFFRRRSLSTLAASKKDKTPVAPIVSLDDDDGDDGKILVTIPSFRDGKLCGETLVELFAKASDPDQVVVNLIEQQNEDDAYCVEVYCQYSAKANVIERESFRDQTRVLSDNEERAKCPRFDQIRVVRISDHFAKGPAWARALGRRNLGNEGFCLQTSTHSSFAQDWDEKAKAEWLEANNEFAVISNPPKAKGDAEQDRLSVPRTCRVNFLEDEELPHYDPHADGMVEKLRTPLLAHTWSPGFSFSKCHLEEAAPSDGFLPYVSSDIEAFARYVRMWTRGYDVYTPTQNIVLRKPNDPESNVHRTEWIDNWRGRKTTMLLKSLKRIRSYLGIPGRVDNEATPQKLDNLGLYGLGKRRTLSQLNEFVGIDLTGKKSRSPDATCGNFEWVPYNSEISPLENLHSNPDNLDPQPEFPLRTQMTFDNDYDEDLDGADDDMVLRFLSIRKDITNGRPGDLPYDTLFVLWVLGLIVYCFVHVFSFRASASKLTRGLGKSTNKKD